MGVIAIDANDGYLLYDCYIVKRVIFLRYFVDNKRLVWWKSVEAQTFFFTFCANNFHLGFYS